VAWRNKGKDCNGRNRKTDLKAAIDAIENSATKAMIAMDAIEKRNGATKGFKNKNGGARPVYAGTIPVWSSKWRCLMAALVARIAGTRPVRTRMAYASESFMPLAMAMYGSGSTYEGRTL